MRSRTQPLLVPEGARSRSAIVDVGRIAREWGTSPPRGRPRRHSVRRLRGLRWVVECDSGGFDARVSTRVGVRAVTPTPRRLSFGVFLDCKPQHDRTECFLWAVRGNPGTFVPPAPRAERG